MEIPKYVNLTLYEEIWGTVSKKVGCGIDADYLTDQIIDAIDKWLPNEHETNSYSWNKCVRSIRNRLK